jgi:drug/metabolite transporter (DMT)-like permease
MSDEFTTNQAVIAAGVGGVAGLGGAAVTALSENMTRKQVAATVIAGLGFGSFVPPAVMTLWQFHPVLSGLIGFCCGLTAVGLVAGVKKIGEVFGKRPGAFIPQLREQLKDRPDDGRDGL